MVGLDHEDIGAARAALDRGSRHHGLVVQRVDQKTHIDELIGKQRAVLIVEERAQFDGAGRRVDLGVERRRAFPSRAVRSGCGRRRSRKARRRSFMRETTSPILSSGMVKSTDIGSSCVTTTTPVVCPALTKLPTSTWRRPASPATGATMRV